MQMQNSCTISLRDGRNVDICTNAGTDALLQTQPSNSIFMANIGDANEIRKKGRKRHNNKWKNSEKSRLAFIGFLVTSITKHSTAELFAEKVSSEEIEFWLDHVITELKEKTTDPRWQRTGVLEQHDALILNPCIYMFMHSIPVMLAFRKGFFQILNDFIEARKAPGLPCANVAGTICLLTSNALVSCMSNETTDWIAEKTLKKLESCGMLVQYIRCSTVPQEFDSNFPKSIDRFYNELYNCTELIKKKFKKGERCGDLVHAILKGKDGHKIKRPKVIKKLEVIASFAKMLEPFTSVHNKHTTDVSKHVNKICRHCNKSDMSAEFQMSLMTCARCKEAFYCSRECQVANWKRHKSQCIPRTKDEVKRGNVKQEIAKNFGILHYPEIIMKMVEVCDKTGLKKADLLLELDFLPDDNDSAPALRTPPEFKIKEARGCFEGSRPNEPDWFYKNEDKDIYKTCIKNVMPGLKDNFERMPDNYMLGFVRYPGGFIGCIILERLSDEKNGIHMFSERAFDAFRSAIHDGNFDNLHNIFDESRMRDIRRLLR